MDISSTKRGWYYNDDYKSCRELIKEVKCSSYIDLNTTPTLLIRIESILPIKCSHATNEANAQSSMKCPIRPNQPAASCADNMAINIYICPFKLMSHEYSPSLARAQHADPLSDSGLSKD